MIIRFSECKREAKRALKGHYPVLIMGFLLIFGVTIAMNQLVMNLFPGMTIDSVILSEVFLFIVALLTTLLTAGMAVIYLKIIRGEAYQASDLFIYLKNQPDRVLFSALVLTVIDLVVSIPANYFAFTTEVGTTLEQQSVWATRYMGLLILSIVLNMILALPFTFIYFLLADHPEYTAREVLKESMRLMKGNKRAYLLLQLSFFPWAIVCVLTFYVGLLWLLPYMEMTGAVFYQKVTGMEKTEQEPEISNEITNSMEA